MSGGLQTDLMGVGLPAEQAILLGLSNFTAFTAAGTTAGTATALTASYANVTAASSQTGVILPSTAVIAKDYVIVNNAASTAIAVVYPPSGGNFNGGATNGGLSIGIGQAVRFIRNSTNAWSAFATQATGGIAPAGGQTVSPRTVLVGGALIPAVSTDFTDTAPVITEAYISEILVPCNMTVTGIAIFNGSNVTGNVRLGLADSAGTVVASSVSTAGSGTDAYQLVPFSAAYAAKGPATYYIISTYSSATARYNAPPLGAFGVGKATGLVYDTFPTSITPPTTFTANLGNVAGLY